jgi:DNA-binding MarR family transcriptional regulator
VRDDGDRRIIKAVMTGKGREFTVNIIEKYREWTEKIMEILDENEKNCMINVLRKLQKGLVEF